MLNNIIIQGRMTKDAELRQTGSGVSVTSFSLAVERDRKDQDGEKKADFIDCTAWRQSAEFISRYGGKGRMVIAQGRLQGREWTDKDGNTRRSMEVQVENVYLCDKKSEAGAAPANGFHEIEESGDLPF